MLSTLRPSLLHPYLYPYPYLYLYLPLMPIGNTLR